MRPIKISKHNSDGEETQRVDEALFILKWGGQLTHAGIDQAIDLGKLFRFNLYPT